MNKQFRVAIFASGSGSNAEEIFKHFQHHPSVEVVLLLSNNPQAFALERAKKFNIDTRIFNKIEFTKSTLVLDWLTEKKVTHIVLAGFLWLVPDYLTKAFHDHIINIHPALLPKFGGKGMYGMKVHEAVRSGNEPETGITIHLVNDRYDEGRILFQARCGVTASDTPDEIAKKVHALEYAHYPEVIEKWINSSSR